MPANNDLVSRSPINMPRIDSVNCGSIIYPVNGSYGPRIQADWQIVLLHSGKARIEVDERILDLEPGDVCLLEPGHKEYFRFSRQTPSWHRWISLHVADEAVPVLWRQALLQPVSKISPPLNKITDTMLILHQAGLTANHPGLVYLALAAIELLCGEVLRTADQPIKHPALVRMADYIRQHFAERVALADLARAAGLSREYLVRLCRQADGQTPMKALWSFRLEQGLMLLKNSGLSCGDIAERCGYASYYHFARCIRASTGQTPTQIRWHALRSG